MQTQHYVINRQEILFEEFEDETVLINTISGYYYSLSDSGTHILHLLQDGCALKDLPAALFGESKESWPSPQIEEFVSKLVEEGILVARSEGEREGEPTDFEKGAPPFQHPGSFRAPVLERFDDVSELLLIDPVHQVDLQYGWPKAFREDSEAGVIQRDKEPEQSSR